MEVFAAQRSGVSSSTPNVYESESVGSGLTSKHAPAHGSRTPSPLVSVNRRFFKLGSVCRMSSARRLRFAMSYQTNVNALPQVRINGNLHHFDVLI